MSDPPAAPMSLRARWRARWRRRNDPRLVRAMFWRGLRHGMLAVRVGVVATVVVVVVVVVWQAIA